jgi:hypothetical protein
VLSEEDFLATRWILIPELVKVHPIPASLWQGCQLLPFALNRVSKLIQVGKLRNEFMAFESLTSSGFYDDALAGTPMDFRLKHVPNLFKKLLHVPCQIGGVMATPTVDEMVRPLTAAGAGEAFDLEREEILGDSFLKYATR